MTNEEDKLDAIFRMQKYFADQIGNKYGFDKRYPEDQLKDLCTAIIHEAVELQDHTNWKWWKIERVIEDKDAVREELVDIFHFVIHAALVLDMTADDFIKEYEHKMEINKQRQEQGY
jgi:dimeric dUTPase (all-alpha-NTP-PPase superfamily)